MTPIELACRHSCCDGNCAAQAGEPCDWSHCDVDGVAEFHAERIEDAAEFGEVRER
jgi:hypothetical protein